MTEPPDEALDGLISRVDLDGLIRMIDDRCAASDWRGILRLRDKCSRAAADTGRQLWPAATLSEYRLALLAPAEWCAQVLDGDSGRFTLGPLSEVAAASHTWAELGPHVEPVPLALFVAHECTIRGEVIDAASLRSLPPILDIPAALQPWEPKYSISTYTEFGAEHPTPEITRPTSVVTTTNSGVVVDDTSTNLAIRQLLDAWTSTSTGKAEVACVEGTHLDALGALGVRSARIVEITSVEALASLAWAGASGGAQGRRRGMAIGRFSMWWLLGALGDMHDRWPPTNADITDLLDELRWYRWDAREPDSGWRLQLVVTDESEGLAWAINASDDA